MYRIDLTGGEKIGAASLATVPNRKHQLVRKNEIRTDMRFLSSGTVANGVANLVCKWCFYPSAACHDKWKEPRPSARAYLSFSLIISCGPENAEG
jgi:hypothetical protein